MSKKTESIYRSIENLQEIQKEISIINQMSKNIVEDEKTAEEKLRHLEKIEFEMMQEIKALRFWVDSLYKYNGRSTSRAKQNASKENGKKGGRPPKEITEARRKVHELEELIIPELEHSMKMADDQESEGRFAVQLEDANNELMALNKKLQIWGSGQKNQIVLQDVGTTADAVGSSVAR